MRHTISLTLFAVLALPAQGQEATIEAAVAGGAEQPAAEQSAESPLNEDMAAILQCIESYVTAFNKGDAQAVAAHWSESGEFVTPAGDVLRGRQQLTEDFVQYFRDSKDAKIELLETTVELISPQVAIESGIARVVVPEQEPSDTEYQAVHIKTPSGWKIDSIREQEPPPPPPTHHEQLQALEWMVGDWVDADEESAIETSCRWTTNHNFLVRSFKVMTGDQLEFEGTQIIGWDPYVNSIRSWLFDSDGGFGVGRWQGSDSSWTVQSLSVLPDGRRATATNIYEVLDENTVQFRSIGRQVDGELMPSIDPVTVTRAQAE